MTDMTLENAVSAIESEADNIGGEYHYVASRLCEAVESIRDHLAKASDYERAVTEQAMLTECVSVTGRDPSDVIRDVIQWHVSNAAQPVEALDIGVGRDIVKRLRDTPNWLKEAWGDFKSAGANKYDRAPKEAADYIETLLAALAHSRPTVPDGYRLVPVEPTDGMCRNAREKIGIGSNVAHHVWHWMISAAPDGEVG